MKLLKKYSSAISNVLMALGTAIGIYVFAVSYLFTGALTSGACPLTINRPWIYVALLLLVLSIIFSLFEKKEKRDSK